MFHFSVLNLVLQKNKDGPGNQNTPRTFDPSLAEAWRKKAFGQKDFLFPSESQRRYPLFDSSYVFVACSMNFFHIQNTTMYYPLVSSTPNAATKCYKGLPVRITKNYDVWTCCSPRPASLRSRVRRKLACVTPRPHSPAPKQQQQQQQQHWAHRRMDKQLRYP